MSTDIVLLRNVLASLRVVKIEDRSDDEIAARMRVTFANGYQANVIRGPWSHGGDRGLFEAAIMVNDELASEPTGYLDVAGVLEFCEKVAALPPRSS